MFGCENIEDFYYHPYLLVNKKWLNLLIKERKIPENFHVWVHPDLSPADIRAHLRAEPGEKPGLNDDWIILKVDKFQRKSGVLVRNLKNCKNPEEEEDFCFAEKMHEKAKENFAKLWHEFNGNSDSNSDSFGVDHDEVLVQILQRIYGQIPLIFNDERKSDISEKTDFESDKQNFAHCAILEKSEIFVLRPVKSHDLKQILSFSPAFLDSEFKKLFVLYQILRKVKFWTENAKILSLGEIRLEEIEIDECFNVNFTPKIEDNLIILPQMDENSANFANRAKDFTLGKLHNKSKECN